MCIIVVLEILGKPKECNSITKVYFMLDLIK